MKTKNIPLDKIVLHPDYGRNKQVMMSGLGPLIESIMASGQIQPCVVRPTENDTYQLLVGRRRFHALEAIQKKAKDAGTGIEVTIQAVIRNASDLEAIEIMVAENLQRANMTLLESVKEIKRLVELGDAERLSPEALSTKLGRPTYWIKQMMALSQLSKKEIQHYEQNLLFVPTEKLLSKVLALPKEERLISGDQLRQCRNEDEAISRFFGDSIDLTKAPFDYTVICAKCTCNTANTPSLFEDMNEAGAARCINEECYRKKLSEFMLSEITRLANEKPDEPFYVGLSWSDMNHNKPQGLPKNVVFSGNCGSKKEAGKNPVRCYNYSRHKIKAGTFGWIDDPSKKKEPAGKKDSKKEKPKTKDLPPDKQLEVKEERLEGLRMKELALFTKNTINRLTEAPSYFRNYSEYELCTLAIAFGIRHGWENQLNQIGKGLDKWNREMPLDELQNQMFFGMQDQLAEIFSASTGDEALDRVPLMKKAYKLLRWDWDSAVKQAEDLKPEPKSMSKLRDEVALAKKSKK